MKISLSRAEIEAVLDSLNAHFSGDTSEGDLAWTDAEHQAAVKAHEKLNRAWRRIDEQRAHEILKRHAAQVIQRAEAALGPLTPGQRVDLILDNMPMVADSREARTLLP